VNLEEHLPARRALLVLIAVTAGLAYLWGVNTVQDVTSETRRFGALGNWDLDTYFLPKFAYGTQEILNGRLPVWNPFEFGGIPFLATAQPATLYPPKILIFALFEPATALQIFFAVHTVLAGITFLLFAHGERLSLTGIVAGVLCYTFSRTLVASTGHPVIIANMAWVPLVFLLSERIARSTTAVSVLMLALVVGLQLTAGYPQIVLDTSLLLALHATVRYATGAWQQPPWKTLPFIALAFTVGAAVAAVQLLPLVELLRITGRVGIAERVVAATAPLPGATMSILLMANSIPGLLAFTVAGAQRRSIVPCAGLLLCVFLTLGGLPLLRLIPGFGAVRLAGTWVALSQFFLAWLVACGVDGVVRAGDGLVRWRRTTLVVGAGCWAAVCLGASISPDLFPPRVAGWLGFGPGGRTALVSSLGMAGALAFVGFGLGRRRALLSAGVVLVVLGHLSGIPFRGTRATVRAQDHPYRSTRLIPDPALREARVLSIVDTRGGFHILDRVENPFGREGSLPPPRFAAVEKRLGVVVQMMRIRWSELSGRRGLLDTLNLRYIVVPRRLIATLGEIDYDATGYGDASRAVLRARDPLGRAWATYGVRVTDSPDQALELLMSPAFDARHQVILERPPHGEYPERAVRSPTPGRVRRISPTRTEVEIDMAEPGVLVLADACFPGWTVEVDGHPAALQCANYLVRGVELAAGPHRVLFRYQSAWVAWGCALSILALLGSGSILVGAFWRRR
jgi:hypothetical protein